MSGLPRTRRFFSSLGIATLAALASLGSKGGFVPVVADSMHRGALSGPSMAAEAASGEGAVTGAGNAGEPYRLFPAALSSGAPERPRAPFGPGIASAEPSRDEAKASERLPVLAGNQVLAFYGKPGAPSMGILGEYTKEALAPLLEGYARLYDDVNGPLGVVPAFYLIFGTCWPEGEIGKLRQSVVESYIEFAASRGWLVFLDHQLGKYGVEESVRSMLPFLRYPNVHLAIDPEWRTRKPMQEIGSISGAELNAAQGLVEEYLREQGLPGVRMLVVHQFKPSMIRDAGTVRADFDRVVLVHTADGFGSPALKRNAYAVNARLTNMPVKGFKLFFESKVVGAGWDSPLMLPQDVMALDPAPLVVMYQ